MTDGPGTERWLEAPAGAIELLRHPFRARSTLRAWDAADAYLLRHLTEHPPVGPLLIVNDGFGALTTGLRAHDPATVADTTMSEVGVLENLARNGLGPVAVLPSIDDLADGPAGGTVLGSVCLLYTSPSPRDA